MSAQHESKPDRLRRLIREGRDSQASREWREDLSRYSERPLRDGWENER